MLPLPSPRSTFTVPRPAGLPPVDWRRGIILLCVLVAAGCGKRGAPLAPLPRVPAAVSGWTAFRSDDIVALSLGVPTANVSGDTPGDIAAVEIYAVTAARAPELVTGRVPPEMTLIASSPVRRPLPPLPASAAADVPAVPREPGLDQGERMTVRERLTPELLVAAAGMPSAVEAGSSDVPPLSLPPVFVPATGGLKRHYAAIAVSRRRVRSAWSDLRSVPIGPVSGAPSAPALTYDAAAIALAWTAAGDARVPPSPDDGELLESRPLGPLAPPTRYNVYAVGPAGPEGGAADATRLNEQPLPEAAFTVAGVTFGQERCFSVRGVDTIEGVAVESPASSTACVTPADTFAPPAPTALAAVGGAGVVSLIWEGVDAEDLAGYLVFRGLAGSEPTTQLTPAPIRASSFEDSGVTPGTRYVYVVVAVDSATPANRSGPSNQAEETARQ